MRAIGGSREQQRQEKMLMWLVAAIQYLMVERGATDEEVRSILESNIKRGRYLADLKAGIAAKKAETDR